MQQILVLQDTIDDAAGSNLLEDGQDKARVRRGLNLAALPEWIHALDDTGWPRLHAEQSGSDGLRADIALDCPYLAHDGGLPAPCLCIVSRSKWRLLMAGAEPWRKV